MEKNKIDQFMLMNSGNFNESDVPSVIAALEGIPDDKSTMFLAAEFKKPVVALIISFLGGSLGIDRFYLGQVGLGVAKLLTCGGFGIWAIIDLFLIMGKTRECNAQKLISLVNTLS